MRMTTGKLMRRESKLFSGALLAALALYPVVQLAGASHRDATPKDATPKAEGSSSHTAAAPAGTAKGKIRQAMPEPGALSRAAPGKDLSGFFRASREAETHGSLHVSVNKALFDLAGTAEVAPERVRVDGSRVNLRAGPSLSAERITAFDRDTRLTVLERGETWTQVKNPETGQTGWMHGNYLKTVTKSSPASRAGTAQEKAGT